MKFYIEFKMSVSEKVYCKEITAEDLGEAKSLFTTQHPDGEVLKIEGRN